MIIKMNNKEEKFYAYMGKMFGSRIIQKQINDRIYDDNQKEWYLYIEDERVVAFLSVSKNSIKNIYTTKEKYLKELLERVKTEIKIEESILPNLYEEVYQKVGLNVIHVETLKNFVIVFDK